MHVTNGIPFRSFALLLVDTVNCVATLKAKWRLRGEFPGLRERAREASITKLVAQGKVHQALGLCGVGLAEKTFLVEELVRVGRYALVRCSPRTMDSSIKP
jgi:hypothetical protein